MAYVSRHLIEDLAGLTLPGYEWKCLMVVLANTVGRNKETQAISLSHFVRSTKVTKSHVCRAINSLESKGLISRVSFRSVHVYSFTTDKKKWSPDLTGLTKELDEAFEKWYVRYPLKLKKEEAKDAFQVAVTDDGATIEQLEDGLSGYLRYQEMLAARFGRRVEPVFMALAMNFLKNKKFLDYIQFKEAPITGKDDAGKHFPVEIPASDVRKEYDKMLAAAMEKYGWDDEDDIDYFMVPTFTEYARQRMKGEGK